MTPEHTAHDSHERTDDGARFPPGDERVSALDGDRICTHCGYNLTGQPVVREAHYRLLIVRCPECATVASLQEYPLLSRWANRWGALLATIWFIFVIAMWPAASGLLFASSAAVTDSAAQRLSRHLDSLASEAEAQSVNSAQSVGATGVAPPQGFVVRGSSPGGIMWTYSGYFPTWWLTQDADALLAAQGGWTGAVEWRATWALVPSSLLALVIGWVSSVLVLMLRRRSLVFVWLAIVALTALFAGLLVIRGLRDDPQWGIQAAGRLIGPQMLILSLAVLAVPLAAGLAFGRALSRMLARTLLSPRLCSTLALLWTAEGKPPPQPRPRRATPRSSAAPRRRPSAAPSARRASGDSASPR